MAADGKNDDDIRRILKSVRTVAMVGASRNPDRASNYVMQVLQRRGFEVTPINPGIAGQQIHGATSIARLADLTAPVDMIDVFRNSAAAGTVIDDVIALPWKPKVIWLQIGVVNQDAARRAEAAGIEVVMNRCPAIELPRLGFQN
jgi:uncharacterized protein